jgi:pimeloyl-ACP methyl ester carboxylesterase
MRQKEPLMKTVHQLQVYRCLTAAALIALAVSCDGDGAEIDQVDQEEVSQLVQGHDKTRPTILLVHGTFADAVGWQKTTALLQQRGYTVTAVENPLTSLAADVASTQRAIAAAKGPVVLVGHSYGGAVISGAAVGASKVKALVYVNAFAPDPGQSIFALLSTAPPTKLTAALLPPDSGGFVFVDTTKFRDAFCADVTLAEANVAAASQKPVAGAAFGETLAEVAWKTIPSWYMVGKQDQAIDPNLERTMAAHIGAHTVEIDSSHVPFISHPQAVVRLIEQAARSVH